MKRFFWGTGRVGRRAYSIAFLLLIVGSWTIHAAGQMVVVSNILLVTLVAPGVLLLEVASTWILTCMVTQRLHDLGRSGWWQLAPVGVACAGFALAEPAWAAGLGLSETAAGVGGIVGALVYLGALVAIGLPRGSTGPNRFGSPPTVTP